MHLRTMEPAGPRDTEIKRTASLQLVDQTVVTVKPIVLPETAQRAKRTARRRKSFTGLQHSRVIFLLNGKLIIQRPSPSVSCSMQKTVQHSQPRERWKNRLAL